MKTETLRYTILETRWGPFGLVAAGDAVRRTCLPACDRVVVETALLRGLDEVAFERGLLVDLQRRIVAYFDGENVDFSTDPAVSLDGRGPFDRLVLSACRRVGCGRKVTYGQLADRIGKPGAARAVGSALARNPVPLIVPCHRVLRGDGGIGGFSAPGGATVKRRLLEHEQALSGPAALTSPQTAADSLRL